LISECGPRLVDAWTQEFIVGQPHDVTEQMFVVQRVYRLNDSLPQDTGAIHWFWQRGGWLLVDRSTGKVRTILLPALDPCSSDVNWFRNYPAYCGISDNAQTGFAIVAQLGRRKPLLKKLWLIQPTGRSSNVGRSGSAIRRG